MGLDMFKRDRLRACTQKFYFRQARCITFAAAGLSFFVAASSVAQTTDAGVVAAQSRDVSQHLVAYGQVEPISVVPVGAAQAGVLTGLNVRPGMHVRAGEELASLGGPEIRAMLLQGEADVRSAQSQLDAAEKSLSIQREQLPSHLTTRQAVHQAVSAVAQAQTGLDNAQSRLNAVRQMTTISAPTDGTVIALASADGALIAAGQPILTLQPSHGLWLRAMYYGADLGSIRIGMSAQFTPADGSNPVAVKVSSVPGTLVVGGGESIAMVPVHGRATWLNGESGTVTLNLPPHKMIVLPTRALVLNQGEWWVMVQTSHGTRPQQVIPGPVEGWDTAIKSGLAPGTKVVVNDAYLLFHSGIAEHFQIPD